MRFLLRTSLAIGIFLVGASLAHAGQAPGTQVPMGNFDSVTSGTAYGWTFDPDVFDQSNVVHFYDEDGIFMNEWPANVLRQDVNDYFGIDGNHGFQYPIPSQYRDGNLHIIYAYGIDLTGNGYTYIGEKYYKIGPTGPILGNIAVNATLDGQPLTGGASFYLCGPTGCVHGGSFPYTFNSVFANESYYISGVDTSGKNLVSITPAASQYLPEGSSIQFTLNFVTPPPPPAPSPCNQVGDGVFIGCYYNNINFSDLALTRNDSQINFNWGNGSPDPAIGSDTFSVIWEGNFNFSDSGTYRFFATTDDGMRVYVDGNLIINSWSDQPPTSYTGEATLNAGTHRVKVEYYENGGGAYAALSWQFIQPVSCDQVGNGAFFGCYYNGMNFENLRLTRTDSQVNFDWGYGSPNPLINVDYFSVKWEGDFNFTDGVHRFTTLTDDGVRLYVDGVLVIDKWIDQGVTAYSADLDLTAGTHRVKMEYYEFHSPAVAQLSWFKIFPSTLQAQYLGFDEDHTAQTYSTQDGQPDHHIQFQGLRGIPAKIRINGNAGGLWEWPFNGSNWVIYPEFGTNNDGEIWFSQWQPVSYHMTVWYPDGSYDETDVVNVASLIAVNATLDGQNWGGNIDYSLSGPSGDISNDTVSTLYSVAAGANYTLNYISGGPPNSVCTAVVPATSQVSQSGATVSFTIQCSTNSSSPLTANICATIVDNDGNIITGQSKAGTQFTTTGLSGMDWLLPTTQFTAPLTFNDDVFGGDGINDAQCVTYSVPYLPNHCGPNQDCTLYGYNQETISTSGWHATKYNDQFNYNVTSPSDFFTYTYGSTDPLLVNANGIMGNWLYLGRTDRTLVILNRLNESSSASVIIKRVGSDGTLTTAPMDTIARVDGNTNIENPSSFGGVNLGAHTAYTSVVSGRTVTAGVCDYPSGGLEIDCALTITCPSASCSSSNGFWGVPFTTASGRVSKVMFQYSEPEDFVLYSLNSSALFATISGSGAVFNSAIITVTPYNNFDDDVSLSVAGISPQIDGFTWDFEDDVLSSNEYSSGSKLTLAFPSSTQPGEYQITIQGDAAGLTPRTLVIGLNIKERDQEFKEVFKPIKNLASVFSSFFK